MTEYYLVSLNELQINQKLELTTEKSAIPFWNVQGLYTENDAKNKIDELYPNGVSKHGIQYLSEKFDFPKLNGKDFVPNMAMIEWTFELIRRNSFKEKPSRFVSVFGCENIEQAKIFKKERRNNQGNIYKVKAENSFKADMNFLYLGPSVLGNQVLAEKYWNGESTKNPFWEILMTGEIEVIKKME
jgi:hypothetical protein